MSTLVQELVKFSEESHFEALPEKVVSETKRIVLDSVGCALAGLSVDKGKKAMAVAKAMPGTPEATVIGTGEKLPAASAAFVNGELINAIDLDLVNTPPGHVTPYVLPAILGTAEIEKSSGKSLISAVSVAHEVSVRIGMATGYYRDVKPGEKLQFPAVSGFSSTIFGGTLGTAMLRKLDTEKTANALGLAGYIAPVQTLAKWGRTRPACDPKYLLSGWLNQAVLSAVLMAEKGYTGDVEVFEGESGFWRMVGASNWNSATVTKELGKAWRFPDITIYKKWAHCRASHTACDCLEYLIKTHELKPDEMEAITVYFDSMLSNMSVYCSKEIDTNVGAQMTPAWSITMVAHGLAPGADWYRDETLANGKYLDFIDRITLKPHPKYEEALLKDPQSRIGKVEVVARGKMFAEERMYRKGTPATPETWMTDDELVEKFRHNASGVLSPNAMERIIEGIFALDELDDVSTLAAMW